MKFKSSAEGCSNQIKSDAAYASPPEIRRSKVPGPGEHRSRMEEKTSCSPVLVRPQGAAAPTGVSPGAAGLNAGSWCGGGLRRSFCFACGGGSRVWWRARPSAR
jgi:hypothetical protein